MPASIPIQDPELLRWLRSAEGRPATPPAWWRCLRSRDPHERALGVRRMPTVLLVSSEVAGGLAADPTKRVRITFCREITRRKLRRLLPTLRKLARETRGDVFREAMAALAGLDTVRAREVAMEGLHSSDPQRRFEALDVLAEFNLLGEHGRWIPADLVAATRDACAAVADRAGLWLARVARPAMVEYLVDSLNAEPGPSPWLIAIVASDLGARDDAVFQALLAPLEVPHHRAAGACARALSRCTDIVAGEFVMAEWERIRPEHRWRLCRTMGACQGNPAVREFLINLLRKAGVVGHGYTQGSLALLTLEEEQTKIEEPIDRHLGLLSPFGYGRICRWAYWIWSAEDRFEYVWNRLPFVHDDLHTASSAARAFRDWSDPQTLEALLHLRLEGAPAAAKLAGCALLWGGPWQGEFLPAIVEHLAHRGFQGAQAWGQACRFQSVEVVRSLMSLKAGTLPISEWEDQIASGFAVALDALNVETAIFLMATHPWLEEAIPGHLLDFAAERSWGHIRALNQFEEFRSVVMRCRDPLATAAIRQRDPNNYFFIEQLAPDEPMPMASAEATQLLDALIRAGDWWSMREYLWLPSLEGLLPAHRDAAIRASLEWADLERLNWAMAIPQKTPSGIRPSEYQRMILNLAGWGSWQNLFSLWEVPFFQPHLLDLRTDLIAHCLKQTRFDCYEWLLQLAPHEAVRWEIIIEDTLNSLLRIGRKTRALDYEPDSSPEPNLVWAAYVLEQMGDSQDRWNPRYWLSAALDWTLHAQNPQVLQFLLQHFAMPFRLSAIADASILFDVWRLITALQAGRYLEARWLCELFGPGFVWTAALQRALAQALAAAVIDCEKRRFTFRHGVATENAIAALVWR